MNIDPKYAREYGAMIKERSEPELMAARQELLTRLKVEQSAKDKDNPAIHNINWQLTLIGRELHSRKPQNKNDRMQAAEGKAREAGTQKSFEEAIREKSLNELYEILELAKKELQKLKDYIASSRLTPDAVKQANSKIDMLTRQIEILEAEIKTRSPKAAEDAQNDFDKASGRGKKIFGIDSDYVIWGAVGGVVGGIVAGSMKKKKGIAGFAILGIGLASAVVFVAKGGLSPQARTAPNV